MAHYACDCWDLELKTSYGWIESAACADRSCYDLEQHAKATGQELVASERLPEPIVEDRVIAEANKGLCGRQFKKDAKLLFQHLAELTNAQAEELEAKLKVRCEKGEGWGLESESSFGAGSIWKSTR